MRRDTKIKIKNSKGDYMAVYGLQECLVMGIDILEGED